MDPQPFRLCADRTRQDAGLIISVEVGHGYFCQPLVSSATAAELIRVLAYPKFKLAGEEQQELLADYLPYCATVRMPAKLPATPVCRDKFDMPFLQLAVAGKADYLVAGPPINS
ncbi:MAG: PIN domain-containing protein [Gallionellaceae bacterium]|nr:PIN domain-containing protein [Gallionellaceae bacterium]